MTNQMCRIRRGFQQRGKEKKNMDKILGWHEGVTQRLCQCALCVRAEGGGVVLILSEGTNECNIIRANCVFAFLTCLC